MLHYASNGIIVSECSRGSSPKKATYGGAHVGDDTVTDLEVLYVLSLLDDTTNGFMSGDELMGEA